MIREATQNDFDEWLRMREQLYPECNSQLLLAEIEKIFSKRTILGELDYHILVYENEDNKLSGFIETSIRKELPGYQNSPVGYIESLYVDPTHRRKGIAKQLVAFSEEWIKSQKYQHLFVDTDPRYTEAIDFYKSIGFKEVGFNEREIILTR
ncbi:GNAT family N-acetyltransferase [Pleurocapsales cyanobacterium LEGE 10410]|nr:GNAT family N-acetyltransferase [Pleurocapsales cyanobacterium LEGE 10410]